MKKIVLSIVTVLVISFSYGQNAIEKGLAIAKAAEKADLGFNSSTVELKMTLKNKKRTNKSKTTNY